MKIKQVFPRSGKHWRGSIAYVLSESPLLGGLFSDSFPKSNLDPKLYSLTTSALTFLEGRALLFISVFSNFTGNPRYPGSLQNQNFEP